MYYFYIYLMWDSMDSACSGDCACDLENAPTLPPCTPSVFIIGEPPC